MAALGLLLAQVALVVVGVAAGYVFVMLALFSIDGTDAPWWVSAIFGTLAMACASGGVLLALAVGS